MATLLNKRGPRILAHPSGDFTGPVDNLGWLKNRRISRDIILADEQKDDLLVRSHVLWLPAVTPPVFQESIQAPFLRRDPKAPNRRSGRNAEILTDSLNSLMAQGILKQVAVDRWALEPPSMTDLTAPTNTVYYSTTQGSLAYKDTGGTVHLLAAGPPGPPGPTGPTGATGAAGAAGANGAQGGTDPTYVPIISGDYAWVNQGAATVTTSGAYEYLEAPAGAGVHIRARMKNVPAATPYSVIVGFTTNLFAQNTMECGFLISDGTQLITFGPQYNTGVSASTLILNLFKFTDVSTFSATYLAQNCWPRDKWWLKFRDDGVNRNWYYSGDGIDFILFTSQVRTDFLTATKWGFFSDPENATWKLGISMFHWAEGA